MMAGKAADELARLRAAEDVDEIVELAALINIRQKGFERWWTFTRPGHPAYPAYVCSWPRERDGLFEMGMDGKCGMDGDACMAFFYEMKVRNAELTREMRALRARQD
jgi:sugar phosphate isomerase/epimerase